jgi:hypothetical protein
MLQSRLLINSDAIVLMSQDFLCAFFFLHSNNMFSTRDAPSHFMTRLELVVDQARSEHRDEKVVQAFAGLIVQEIFYD